MTFNQLIKLLPKVVKYNLKIIFAGKFFWFLLAAFGFFAFFMFQSAWNRAEINEGLIYNILMFPCLLLIFYPAVFGIQNDANITDWSYGFTTATKVLDTGRVSSYITKYITKSVDEHLKEKRRYYYSRNCHIAEEEHFLLDEEDFRKIYADRIVYVKTVDVPQASQQITYYELKY